MLKLADMKGLEGLAYLNEGDTLHILYEPSREFRKCLENYEDDNALNYIRGVLQLKYNKKYNCMEIDSIYAQKGYGPILYLLGLQSVGKDGLIPNRSRVTQSAKNIWKEFFSGKGSSFVRYQDISDNMNHKEEYLNKIYYMKKTINVKKAEMLNKRFIGSDQYGEFKTQIIEMVDSFLTNKMSDIYGEVRMSSFKNDKVNSGIIPPWEMNDKEFMNYIPPKADSGYRLLYHATISNESANNIFKEGLSLSKAKGHVSNEPDLIWATTSRDGYSKSMPLIIFQVPVEDKEVEYVAANTQARISRDIKARDILAIDKFYSTPFGEGRLSFFRSSKYAKAYYLKFLAFRDELIRTV